MTKISCLLTLIASPFVLQACSQEKNELSDFQAFYKANSPAAQTCLQYGQLFGEAYEYLGQQDSPMTAVSKLQERHRSSQISSEQEARFMQVATGISLMASGLHVLSKEGASIAFLQICRSHRGSNTWSLSFKGKENPVEKAVICEKSLSSSEEKKKCIVAAFVTDGPRDSVNSITQKATGPASSGCRIRSEQIPDQGLKLIDAAQCGDVELIRELIESGVPIDSEEPRFKKTALDFAAERGDVNIVTLLLNRGANANHDASGYTPLIFAAVGGHNEIIEILLRHGVNPNQKYFLGTPLIAAVNHRKLSTASTLIRGGADVNFGNGQTALHRLVREEFRVGDDKLIEFLLDAGADPLIQDGRGKTALEVANPQAKLIIERKLARK